MIDITECRAALRMIRATIEEHCPPGVLLSEDQVNGQYGPTLLDEAEALSVAIVATVERLSFEPREIPLSAEQKDVSFALHRGCLLP
ncbi:hypothetical protein [Mesorhizobium sp.]|uniref:hypothetical protein n=1 Tax=Mesorhizobium sp. TaxID=1871066 RepID=UPI0025C5C6B9|nr:hypothetical protein [Mesorhizobium sp.]